MECMWNGDLWSSTSHDIKSLKVPTSPSRGKENTLNNNGSNTDILISLAKNGDYKRLSFLVNHEKKLDLNGADSKGRTALMVAAARNHISIIKCLLEKGASASKQSTVGQTALMMAAGRGNFAAASILVAFGSIDTVEEQGWSATFFAATTNCANIVRLLLSNGADPNGTDKIGQSALQLASYLGHEEVVRALLEHDAQGGYFALLRAAEMGREQIARMLISNGADINQATEKGKTALSVARDKRHQRLVDFLLEQGAIESDLEFSDKEEIPFDDSDPDNDIYPWDSQCTESDKAIGDDDDDNGNNSNSNSSNLS